MVFKEFKGTMSVTNRLIFELLHDQSLKKADMLWSISYATKKGIDKYFPVRKSRDVFVGFFINTQIFKRKQISSSEKENLSLRFNLHHKTLLFVGTLEPRKNLKYLLSLMPELAIQGYNLLVVGAKGWGNTDIKQIVDSPGYPRESVVFAGFLTSEELVSIYNLASVYVSTSHNEGFGMPQLEAMACGCPVVSPHNSAMIEVVEGAGETVKSWDAQDWINTINQVYTNREYYIQAGFQRVETYKVGHVIKNLTHYIEQHL
jgi:glycosyltransferase involved in cell wall biosynthesis